MKFTKIALTVGASIGAANLLAAPAMAQDSGAYGTLGVKTIEFDSYALEGRLGYNLNQFLSVEGEGAFGISSDDDVAGLDVKEDFTLGGYARVSVPIAEQFKLFGRLGYQYSEFSFDSAGLDVTRDFDGLAYGGGVEVALSDRNALRFDYTKVDYGGGASTNETVSLAFVRKF